MPTVLIVGASRGIGLELARQHAADGHRVLATARDADGRARIAAAGAHPLALDVQDAAQCAGLAWQLDGERIGTAWLCAGIYGPRSAGVEPPGAAEFDAVMHTNVLAAMRLAPVLLELLQPAPGDAAPARLGVLSSRMGSIGLRQASSGWLYRASKAALNSVLADIALAARGRAICAAFHPGWVRTDMGGSAADLPVERSAADLRASLAALSPADNGGFFNHDGQRLSW